METQRICPSCQKPLPPDVPLGLCPECLIKSGFNTGTDPGNPGKGSGFVPPPVEELRKLFPQLEIIELIGKGGMGAVYKARQPALDRLVALKILPPGAADDAGFTERFNREARALARLNHPHIVAVHDFGQAGGQPYLVMEFVDGPNLRQVEQAGRLTPEQALEIVPQICEALQFAHNEGVVHRDIKPENILLDKKGRVKITDFGIAKIVGVPAGKISLTGAKDVLGTPHYMAPEQVEKPATVDHRADIYSLGVVFYELLTGELPLGKFQPPSRKVQMDVRLDEVVLHALEKEPERRYQQASQVKTDVETIAATPSSGSSGCQSAPTGDQSRLTSAATIQSMVKVPAIGLIVTSCLTLLVLAVALPLWVYGAALSMAGKISGIPWAFVIPLLLLMTGCNLVALVGAWRMRQLRSYSLAVVGSILFMLSPWIGLPSGTMVKIPFSFWSTMPSVLLGLLFGIWSLIVLSRRDVQEAFQRNRLPGSSTLPPKPAPSAAESPLAKAREEVKYPAMGLVTTGILNWIAIPLIVFITVGIVAGKGGAVVALPTLLIPLSVMVLSSMIIVAGLKMKRLEAYPLAIVGSILAILVTPGNLIGLPVGIWSLVVLCRSEVREAFGGKILPDVLTPGVAAASVPRPDRFWRRFAVTIALVLLALSLIPVGAVLLSITLPALNRAKVNLQQQSEASDVSTAFGPVQQVTLNDLDESHGNEALSFASAKLLSLPADFGKRTAEARVAWLDSNRVDLLVDYARDRWALLTRSMKFRDLPNEKWDSPHVEIGGDWPESAVLEKREHRGDTFYLLPTNAQPPLTFAFQTSAGSHGVLQITGFAENPRGLKLRYKLYRKPVALKFGPVIEKVVTGMIDLETGALVDWPLPDQAGEAAPARYAWINDEDPQAWPWMRERGIDAVDANHGLLGVDLVLVPVKTNDWQTLTPEELQEKLRSEPVPQTRHSANFSQMPGTYGIQTREGSLGLLQVLGPTYGPRGLPVPGVKIRYKLAQPSGGSGGGWDAVGRPTAAAQNAQRKFVRLVADKTALTFEDQPTSWEEVGALLAKVPDRKNTVLEFAVTSDQITVAQQNEWFQKASALARQHGFEYASFIGIHPLGSKGTSSSSTRSVPPLAQARPGEYRVALTNGVTVEVVALTSTPRAGLAWWQPNGALLAESPGDRLGELSGLCPSGKSSVEFAVLFKETGKATPERVLLFEPLPHYVNSTELFKGDQFAGAAAVIGCRATPENLTCKIGVANGPEERVATWDGAGTLLSNETGGPLQFVRSGADGESCFKLGHRVDPVRFNVRLAARLKNGEHKLARVCRVEYGDAQDARLCALIRDLQDSDVVVAYELYRVPLRWTIIPGIATKPTVAPVPATVEAFGPVMTRSVSGEGDARRRFIDFETGRQFAASEFFGPKAEPSPEETQKWWKENGIDAMGDTSPAVSGLVGFDMIAVPVPLHEWDMPPARLEYYLAAAKPGTPATMSAKGDLPATFVIQTREGGRGLLQISGFSGFITNTRSVMIRYKLAGQTVRDAAPAKARPTADQVAVEDLALRMLAAIRDKEDDRVQSLAVDRIKGWRESLPHFAFEARERFQQMRGRPFNLLPIESLVEGDHAVVKCDDPKATNQIYLVLHFVKTDDGWRNWSLRNSPPHVALGEYLKQLPPNGPAGTPKANR